MANAKTAHPAPSAHPASRVKAVATVVVNVVSAKSAATLPMKAPSR